MEVLLPWVGKDDVMHDWNNTPRRMQVSAFFIGETEITNYEYREYVTWLKFVFPPSDQSFKNIYTGALPDTLVWNNKLSRNDLRKLISVLQNMITIL